jgi:hypothetical protein
MKIARTSLKSKRNLLILTYQSQSGRRCFGHQMLQITLAMQAPPNLAWFYEKHLTPNLSRHVVLVQ